MIRMAGVFLAVACFFTTYSQQVTGVWKGSIDGRNAEIKIIQKGDSLTGTSYYYQSANAYKRYSIKGYFDAQDNSVVWWDDQLLEDKEGKRLFTSSAAPLLSEADFNCPGAGKMYLHGMAGGKENPQVAKGPVNLTKTGITAFPDEWNYVIDNYIYGTNDPDIIDSVALIATAPKAVPPPMPPKKETAAEPAIVMTPPPPPIAAPAIPARPMTIEEKYTSRKKVFTTDIPLTGDSIELRFYDNAEVDGDSISLFLNDKLIFEHIRLTEKAYTIKLPVKELKDTSVLTMVAENLGAIPPNTSYMVALVGDKRYEALLASTENSSAAIRLRKQNL